MNRKELEAAVQRDCVGEGRTHHNTCPCQVLELLDERNAWRDKYELLQADVQHLCSRLLESAGL